MVTELQETLRRLSYAFVAGDIMKRSSELTGASSEEEARRLLEQNPQYDIIPIHHDGKYLSFLERGKQRPRVIQIQHTVGAETPILELVESLRDFVFVFVVGCREITGLVHFSDLNDPVVKLPFFVLLEGVERFVADIIRERVTESLLPELIHPKRLDTLKKKMAKLQRNDADRDWISLFYFREVLDAAVRLRMLLLTSDEVVDLSDIRNQVAHATTHQLVETHVDVRRLIRVRSLCIDLLAGRRRPNQGTPQA